MDLPVKSVACPDDALAAEADEDGVDELLQRVSDLVRIASRPTAPARGSGVSAEAGDSVEEGAGTGSTFTSCTEVLRLQRENAALLSQVRAAEAECALQAQKTLELEATHEAALTSWNKDMLHLNVVQTRELQQLRENDGLQRALQARGAEVAELRRALAASETDMMLRAPQTAAGYPRPELLGLANKSLSTSQPALLECERCGHRFQVEYAVVMQQHAPDPDVEVQVKTSREAQAFSRLDEECRAVLQRLFPANTAKQRPPGGDLLADASGGGCIAPAMLVPQHRRASPHRAGKLRLLDGSVVTDPGLTDTHLASRGSGSPARLVPRYGPSSPRPELRRLNDGSAVTDPGAYAPSVYTPRHRLASPHRVMRLPVPMPDPLVSRAGARQPTPPPSPRLGLLCRTGTVRAPSPPSSPGYGFRRTLGLPQSVGPAPVTPRGSFPTDHPRGIGSSPKTRAEGQLSRSVSPSYGGASSPRR